MPEILELLVKKYRVFYEVSPCSELIEDAHGSAAATRHIVQAGFDVDVCGLSNKDTTELPPPGDYALGYAALEKIADGVAQHASECSIDVIPFASTAFSEPHSSRSEAVIRIRISHRGIPQPVGLPEQQALEELERQLQSLGLRRR
jgi:hypothetical protein